MMFMRCDRRGGGGGRGQSGRGGAARGGGRRLLGTGLAAGGVDEGGGLAWWGTGGAMATWAVAVPGNVKASTASMQIQILGPAPKGDLVAYGRCVQNDNEIYWSDVEVASVADGKVNARGTVLYRIVK